MPETHDLKGIIRKVAEIIIGELKLEDVTADVHLREKGYLMNHPNNLRMSILSPDMNSIRESFVANKKEVYVLLFQKDK